MSDTSLEAARIQAAIQRRLTGEQRLCLAFEMSMLTRELCFARLRQEHPDWTDDERRREVLRYAFAPGPFPPPLS